MNANVHAQAKIHKSIIQVVHMTLSSEARLLLLLLLLTKNKTIKNIFC